MRSASRSMMPPAACCLANSSDIFSLFAAIMRCVSESSRDIAGGGADGLDVEGSLAMVLALSSSRHSGQNFSAEDSSASGSSWLDK